MVEFSVVSGVSPGQLNGGASVVRLPGSYFSGSQVEVNTDSNNTFFIMSNGTQYNGEEYRVMLIQCVGYD